MAQRTETAVPRERRSVRVPRFSWWIPVVVVVGAVALFVMANLIATSPPAVDHLTLVNGTEYNLVVAIGGANGDASLPIGTAPAHATTELQGVTDQGPTWVFHFGAQGQDGGDVRINRSDLAAARWRVEVPAAVGARLRSAGAPASPVHSP